MFDSFKKAIGSLPESTKELATYNYVSNFEMSEDSFNVISCEPLKVSVLHHFFRYGQELEVLFYGQPSLKYFLTKLPYPNSQGCIVYELTEKISKNEFVLVIDLDNEMTQFMSNGNFNKGFVFSIISLEILHKKERTLVDYLVAHYFRWEKENEQLFFERGIELYLLSWEVDITKEAPILSLKYQESEEDIKKSIKRYSNALLKNSL